MMVKLLMSGFRIKIVWLFQAQMQALFGREGSVITKHGITPTCSVPIFQGLGVSLTLTQSGI
jgi:hypothetical protein